LPGVQGLDLTLLIHTEHNRVLGRIEVETHDAPDFGDELRIGAEFECFPPDGVGGDAFSRCVARSRD
jgi:hypothetical protein